MVRYIQHLISGLLIAGIAGGEASDPALHGAERSVQTESANIRSDPELDSLVVHAADVLVLRHDSSIGDIAEVDGADQVVRVLVEIRSFERESAVVVVQIEAGVDAGLHFGAQ